MALLIGATGTLHSQGTRLDPGLDALRARADSLASEWRRASAVADVVDSIERTVAGSAPDTIRVGALTIITNRSPLPLREAAAAAWHVIDSLYGADARALAQRPYLVSTVDPDTTIEPRPRVGTMAVPWDVDVTSLTRLLLVNVPMPAPDSALRSWLGAAIEPFLEPARTRGAVYVQLVTAGSEAARRCLLGDLAGCRNALDLVESGDRLALWYPTPQERRALVLRSFPLDVAGPGRIAIGACVAGRDSACSEVLRSLAPGALPPPLGSEARETLVAAALRLGGRDAYHRLLASAGATLETRLTAAARVGIDSLVASWRTEILAARPAPVSVPRRGLWIALGWAGFFGLCGLRSSRWRVS